MKIVSYEEVVGPDVVAEVVSQQGHCGAGYKVGDRMRFCGFAVEGRVCLHALDSMLSIVNMLKFGGSYPWRDDPDTAQIACPDASNPVVFEIRRFPGQVSGKE